MATPISIITNPKTGTVVKKMLDTMTVHTVPPKEVKTITKIIEFGPETKMKKLGCDSLTVSQTPSGSKDFIFEIGDGRIGISEKGRGIPFLSCKGAKTLKEKFQTVLDLLDIMKFQDITFTRK